VKSDDVEAIKAKSSALAQAAMKLGEALYGAQGGAGGGPQSSSDAGEQKKNGASGENVVDADFEEVKDDKKKSA
jgi:molecular chaperone DnaK